MRANDSPEQVLLGFIERQPALIREVLLARCCSAFGRLHDARNQKLFATYRAILTTGERASRAYACAQMIGVMELALQQESDCNASLQSRDLAADEARCSDVDMRMQRVRKQWRAATDEFIGLRKDALSIDALRRLMTSNQPLAKPSPGVRHAPAKMPVSPAPTTAHPALAPRSGGL